MPHRHYSRRKSSVIESTSPEKSVSASDDEAPPTPPPPFDDEVRNEGHSRLWVPLPRVGTSDPREDGGLPGNWIK